MTPTAILVTLGKLDADIIHRIEEMEKMKNDPVGRGMSSGEMCTYAALIARLDLITDPDYY